MQTPQPKPVALVLDDEWKDRDTRVPVRAKFLDQWIGNLVDLHGISFYTLPSLRRRELGEGRTPERIAAMKPRLILLDLDILDSGVWTDGLQYLYSTLRDHPELKDVPVVVISTWVNEQTTPRIVQQGIPKERVFNWAQLVEDSGGLQQKFRTLVRDLVREPTR